ncbi:hypothetical protein [Komagataeibacter kakiaceti]|uniref:hypothetical protein n=1 Tax=Komagataeibacter kakiaceti TaxID=943261 RepID=UPI001F59BC23|nr:hypothetical protein [Komagataeibacter kakiaceti]
MLADEVWLARSSCSTSSTDAPRPAASRAMPVPLIPPPTTSRSTGSPPVGDGRNVSSMDAM